MDQQMSPHGLQTILQGLSADDIALKHGDPSKIYFIKGAVCASGMYDLYPASLSARNLYLNFHLGDTMTALSPILHIDNIHFPIVIGHGTKETPEFQRQSDDFAAAVRAAGKDVTLIVAPGYNHFEFAETFANPYGALGRASLKLMGLQPGAALIWGQRPK